MEAYSNQQLRFTITILIHTFIQAKKMMSITIDSMTITTLARMMMILIMITTTIATDTTRVKKNLTFDSNI